MIGIYIGSDVSKEENECFTSYATLFAAAIVSYRTKLPSNLMWAQGSKLNLLKFNLDLHGVYFTYYGERK